MIVSMNGIQLSEKLFTDIVYPVLVDKFYDSINDISVALLGEGSEVLGYDDEISQDHNFCPRMIIFVKDKKYPQIVSELRQEIISSSPEEFFGFKLLNSHYCKFIEVVPLEKYFLDHLHIDDFPSTNKDWLKLDEQKLVEITSGKIFFDPQQKLQNTINRFNYYPEDVRLYLLSICFSRLSEVGGIERAIRRQDIIATDMYRTFFSYFIIKTLHLYKGKYCPYCKWMGKNLETLGEEGKYLETKLNMLIKTSNFNEIRVFVKEILFYVSNLILNSLNVPLVNSDFKEKLTLLDYDWDMILNVLQTKLSDDLKSLYPHVSPLNYWGLMYDVTGFDSN